LMKINDFFLY